MDVDEDLYGGFLSQNDRRSLERLRGMNGEQLAALCQGGRQPAFDDERLDELLFRYRARNFPAGLGEAERQRWQQHCARRLHEGEGGFTPLAAYFEQLDALQEAHADDADERAGELLSALYDYAESIAPGTSARVQLMLRNPLLPPATPVQDPTMWLVL